MVDFLQDDMDFSAYMQETEVKTTVLPASTWRQGLKDSIRQKKNEARVFLPWAKVNPYFDFRKGEVTIWAGQNGHGKSQVTDMVKLSLMGQNQKVGNASFEMKRFEFVEGDEIVIAPGRTVKRIRALVEMVALGVASGDLGGYIEKESQVYGNAWVYGSAQVSGSALVYGNGLICWFSNVGSEDGTLTIYNTKDNCIEVTRGCFQGTPEEFLAASAEKHDERIQHEYRLLIEVGISRVTAARAKEEE